ncbi:MAG: endonuclease/exonuclease/phosphatase family protein [Pyrinomonadaceae bacterium]
MAQPCDAGPKGIGTESRSVVSSADITAADKDGGLLETGGPSPALDSRAAAARSPAKIKVVSYNMRWRGGEDLQKLIRLLREDPEIGGADIIGLQEVDRGKKRTNYINTARLMAEDLGMHYAWAAPPRAGKSAKEDETGVAILSPHPLGNVVRLVLPHEGPNRRRRVAIGATVRIGPKTVRVYSVHAETRLKCEKKMDQLRAPIEDLARHPHVSRAAVLGDFNTIKGKDVKGARALFTEAGFETPFPDDRSTWHTFIIELKLDWVWLRGLEPLAHGIDKGLKLSDHWPLWVELKLDKEVNTLDR